MQQLQHKTDINDAICNAQTHSLNKGLQIFKDNGKIAVIKEISQLHNRGLFTPILPTKVTDEEKYKAMDSIIFITEKRDCSIKAQACANGSVQRKYITKEEASSPTVTMDGLLTTCCIDAKQEREIITLDIPNAFVQTPLPDNDEGIIMQIKGKLAEILTEQFPMIYSKYIQIENNSSTLYIVMRKALYGMMMSSLLFYRNFRKDLESIGLK